MNTKQNVKYPNNYDYIIIVIGIRHRIFHVIIKIYKVFGFFLALIFLVCNEVEYKNAIEDIISPLNTVILAKLLSLFSLTDSDIN